MTDWVDGVGQAELVRRGEVTPLQLVDEAIARIEKLNPELNAVHAPMFDLARKRATGPLPEGPFRGVPTVLKDLGACEAGMPLYQGSALLKEMDWHAPADTIAGARLRDAGFVPVAKMATPEFGGQPTTQPRAFGPCRNPWDTTRSVSGSSGGSAAAVASGMVSIAHATDGYGSIRDPASWCGVVGLKPSRGRVPIGPVTARVVVEHVVTRTVRDTAAVLDAIAGPPHDELYLARASTRPYAAGVGADPGRLRIGVLASVDAPGIVVDDECVTAALTAGRLLESLGHIVVEDGPAGLIDEWAVENLLYVRGVRSWALNSIVTALGRSYREDEVEPYTWAVTERGRSATAVDYLRAAEWQQPWTRSVISWWNDHDLLLTPTTGRAPMLLDDLVPPPSDPISIAPTFHSIRAFAAPFNITGQPAISLPLYWTDGGLPIGAQLVAAPNRDDILIRVAAQLEEAAPWAGRWPQVSGRPI